MNGNTKGVRTGPLCTIKSEANSETIKAGKLQITLLIFSILRIDNIFV